MPEYGRCVYDMIQHAKSIEDRAERQRCAESIVAVMTNMQTATGDKEDMRRRVWDHLAFIADYQLDIDYPVEITRLGADQNKPERVPYPMSRIRHRQYGHVLEQMLAKLTEMPAGAERDELLRLVANQMKQSLFVWNRDAMDEQKVASDIAAYTKGKVTLDLSTFHFDPVQTLPRQDGKKRKKT